MDRRFAAWLVVMTLALGTSLSAQKKPKPAPADTVAKNSADLPTSDKSDAGVSSTLYKIGNGDLLHINVWHENEISQNLAVRPDGMISLPLIGDVQAAGQTPEQLSALIQQKLSTYITSPHVTVIVTDIRSKFFTVTGEVAKPGTFALAKDMTVLEALAEAGGFKDFAKTSKIYVLHHDEYGHVMRSPFNYPKVVKGEKPEQNIGVSHGDTIVVP